jgi:hypothetical protein
VAVRKNQNKLTDAEKTRVTNAVKKMKAETAQPYNYDKYVTMHNNAFVGGPDANPAHMGPAFFPWHRYFLLKFEHDLQDADRALGGDGGLTLPYWDWTNDNDSNPKKQRASVWSDKLMGGDGDPIKDGPFSSGWTTVAPGPRAPGPLVRALGQDADAGSLPTKAQWDAALDIEGFDCDDFATGATTTTSVASPPAPSLSGAIGGSLAAGIYRVVVTYVNAQGETRPSAEATICLGGGCTPGNSFDAMRVASPPARPPATQYKVYVSAPGGAAGSETLQAGPTAIGTATTVNSLAAGPAPPTMNSTASFRNAAEGWKSTRGEPEMHNRVHVWVGGNMGPGTSPNDPIFFLHHCNVDRFWTLWQFRHPGQNYPLVVPGVASATPRPHGLNDEMPPWNTGAERKRPIDVLNHSALGYTYDTDPPGASINVSP